MTSILIDHDREDLWISDGQRSETITWPVLEFGKKRKQCSGKKKYNLSHNKPCFQCNIAITNFLGKVS